MNRSFSNLKGLSLERLRTLALVAKSGGLAKAAEAAASDQGLFSRQLAELERYFGASLLDRSTKPHDVTELGRNIAAQTELFFNSIEDLLAQAHEGRETVVVGAGEALIRSFLVPMSERWLKEGIKLVFRNLKSREIQTELRARRIDIGVMHKGRVAPDFATHDLGQFPMTLLIPEAYGHLVVAGSISWQNLAKVPLAILEGDGGFSRFLSEQAGLAGVHLDVAVECSSYPQMGDLMRCAKLAGFLPSFYLKWLNVSDGMIPVKLKHLNSYSLEPVLAWSDGLICERPAALRVLKDLRVMRKKV